MLIFALQPLIDFIVEYIIVSLTRWYNRTFVYKSGGVQENELESVDFNQLRYIDLYVGPEYCFYFKCANISLIVFITLIFGQALPCLYLITLVSILIQYLMERLNLTYFYRLPPKFQITCTLTNIRIMSFAPLISLCITFWFYTNK